LDFSGVTPGLIVFLKTEPVGMTKSVMNSQILSAHTSICQILVLH